MSCRYAPRTNDSDCITWCFSFLIKEKRYHLMNREAFRELIWLICSLYISIRTILMTTIFVSISMKIVTSVDCWHVKMWCLSHFRSPKVKLYTPYHNADVRSPENVYSSSFSWVYGLNPVALGGLRWTLQWLLHWPLACAFNNFHREISTNYLI